MSGQGLFDRALSSLEPKMLNMRELRVIVALAEEGGFTRAAARLGVSQPAVSQQVRRIEHLLGRPLFHRTTQTLALTPDGLVLLEHARAMLEIAARATSHFTAIPSFRPLRIGLTGELTLDRAKTLLQEARARAPQVRIAISTERSRALFAALDAGRLDMVVATRPPGTKRGTVLCRHRLTWVGLPGTLSAAKCGPVPLAFYSEDAVSHGLMTTAAVGRTWTVAFESTSTTGLRAAVRAGLGLSAFERGLCLEDVPWLAAEAGLPPLGTLETVVEQAPRCSPAVARVAAIVREAAVAAFSATPTGEALPRPA